MALQIANNDFCLMFNVVIIDKNDVHCNNVGCNLVQCNQAHCSYVSDIECMLSQANGMQPYLLMFALAHSVQGRQLCGLHSERPLHVHMNCLRCHASQLPADTLFIFKYFCIAETLVKHVYIRSSLKKSSNEKHSFGFNVFEETSKLHFPARKSLHYSFTHIHVPLYFLLNYLHSNSTVAKHRPLLIF